MKNLLTFLLASIICVSNIHAQNEPDPRPFSATEFLWFGLDFSHARFIGAAGFTNPEDIKNRYIKAWNALILNESEKYDLIGAYGIQDQKTDLSVVRRRNALVNVDTAFIETDYQMDPVAIDVVISDYKPEDATEGLGIVYIIEAFDKNAVEGSMYVVFFDIASHEILWKKRYVGVPGGFGVRNFWARSILQVIEASGEEFTKSKPKKR